MYFMRSMLDAKKASYSKDSFSFCLFFVFLFVCYFLLYIYIIFVCFLHCA